MTNDRHPEMRSKRASKNDGLIWGGQLGVVIRQNTSPVAAYKGFLFGSTDEDDETM
jgi:hypothetical protein